MAGPAALARTLDLLESAGTAVRRAGAGEAAARGVTEMAWFTDPFGLRNELSWGQPTRPATFRPGRPLSGFRTGGQGLGHAVLVVPTWREPRRSTAGCPASGSPTRSTCTTLVRDRGIPLAMTLGRHTNDLMTSFDVRTPSGFEIEHGFGGADIQSTQRSPRSFSRTSIRGHHPPARPLGPGIIRAHTGENR